GILGYATTLEKEVAQIKLGGRVVFQRGALIPLESLAIVVRNSGADQIEQAELVLRCRIALVRGLLEPAGGCGRIPLHAQAELKGAGNLELLLEISGLGALEQMAAQRRVLRKRG